MRRAAWVGMKTQHLVTLVLLSFASLTVACASPAEPERTEPTEASNSDLSLNPHWCWLQNREKYEYCKSEGATCVWDETAGHGEGAGGAYICQPNEEPPATHCEDGMSEECA